MAEEQQPKDFNAAAQSWDEKPRRVELARSVAFNICRDIPLSTRMHALEYGCGTGLVSMELADKLGQITAVDSSAGMLNKLKEKAYVEGATNITTFLVDEQNPQLPPGPYDIIYSSMVLHHVPDLSNLLGKLAEALNPGGYLVVADLDKEDGNFHDNPSGVQHYGFYPQELGQMLSSLDIVDIHWDEAHVIRKEREGRIDQYPVLIMTGRKAPL